MAANLDRLRASASLAAIASLAACASGATRLLPPATPPVAVAVPVYTPAEALVKADEAWEAGEFALAKILYGPIVERDDSPPSAAIFRFATLIGWDNRLTEAENLFRRYVALEPGDPEGRVALGRALAWQGRYPGAIAVYDSVLAVDPKYRNAVLARAQALAWAGRLKESLAAYQQWIQAHPGDTEARLTFARVLAWDGRLSDSEFLYTELARTGNLDATKGLARIIGWRGDLERSERMWRQALVTDPNDAEARTGLAQILSWQGQQLAAETELQHVLRANPGYGDARTLLRTVQADLSPSLTTTAVAANDSDRNRVSTLQLDYSARALWNGSTGARYSERWADFLATESRATALNLFASWHPRASEWIIRADAGATRQSFALPSSPRRNRTLGNGGIRFVGGLGPVLRLGFGASTGPFDETALLIANGIVISNVEAEASLPLPRRFSFAAGAAYSRLTRGTADNARRAGSASLRWTASRKWSMAVGARQFGYETSTVDGYFSPRRYVLADFSVRGRAGNELGWNADGEAGLGRQSISLFNAGSQSRRAERVAASIGYRFTLTREITAAATYSNVASPGQTGGSEYNANSVLLRARIGF